jgi:hypothetical protein
VSAAITQPEVHRLMRAKMDYNSQIIVSASEQIIKATTRLQEATKTQSMDQMNAALKEIVDASVSCRSRLQFMRGCWSYYKDMMESLDRQSDPSDT